MDFDSSSRRVEKRNRPPVSCEPCRTRKLKCSRTSPCESCVRRDRAASCLYATNAVRNHNNNNNLNRAGGASTVRSRPVKPRELKDRLSSLETLVSSFLTQSSSLTTAKKPLLGPSQDVSLDTEDSIDMTTEQLSRTTFSIDDHEHQDLSSASRNTRVGDGTTAAVSTEAVLGSVKFIDPSHWLSILDDIKEVREHLTSEEDLAIDTNSMQDTLGNTSTSTTPSISSDPSILLASPQAHGSTSLDEILTRLPAKSVCDMLLSWYFNSQFMVLGVVHPVRFQSEYEQFWKSPSTTSPLWIALLFSVLGITICFRRLSGIYADESQTNYATAVPEISLLQQSTLQCLVLGRYATATAHALEALILHLQSTFTSHALGAAASAAMLANELACKNNTALVDAWFLMGTIIRLAFRMGYHREEEGQESLPAFSTAIQNRFARRGTKKMSVFDAEMRRRVWINVVQIDALLSFQIGLPSMIVSEACDTKVPLNLEYADLDPSMMALPAPRPLEHYTPSLYTIVKAGVMAIFKKITTHAMAPRKSISGDDEDGAAEDDEYDRKTALLDKEMRTIYRDPTRVPLLLRARDVAASSIIDSACLISQRVTIEILHLKGLVVLHRRYVVYTSSAAPTDAMRTQRHRGFRRACVAAAMDILDRQADLHAACSPGGRLFHDRWMPICAVPVSDYLLAAMVVCLDLSVRMRDGRGHGSTREPGRGAENAHGVHQGREDNADDDDLLTAREYHALQTSHRIYTAASSASPDARVAAQALGLMLRKVAESDAANMSDSEGSGVRHGSTALDTIDAATTMRTTTSGFSRLDQSPSIPTLAWDYTPPSTTTTSSSQSGLLHDEPIDLVYDPSELSYAIPMSMMIDGSESVDWGLLDQFLQNIDPAVQDQIMDLT